MLNIVLNVLRLMEVLRIKYILSIIKLNNYQGRSLPTSAGVGGFLTDSIHASWFIFVVDLESSSVIQPFTTVSDRLPMLQILKQKNHR